MGKSETAKMFAKLGVPIFDTDAVVHRLYERGGSAVPQIAKAFPSCVAQGAVDRASLAAKVAADTQSFRTLESIVHPLVAEEQRRFLDDAESHGIEMVVLDVPLLFETGSHASMDAIVVVSAPAESQRSRVLSRPGMTTEKLDQILARQLPDSEKRAKADFVVETSQGLDHAFEQVKRIVTLLHRRRLKDHNIA